MRVRSLRISNKKNFCISESAFMEEVNFTMIFTFQAYSKSDIVYGPNDVASMDRQKATK